MKVKNHDISICKWSSQVDGYCPYEELLNMLVNSVSKKKIKCKNKECLVIMNNMNIKDDEDLLYKTNMTQLKKPSGPSKSMNLLNQFNIMEILHDLSVASNNSNTIFKNGPFYAIEFEMRDFMDNINSELRDIDFNKLRNAGFKSFGCVLNTDVWSGPGKHWVCIFGTIGKSITVEYFNSSGNGLELFPELYIWIDEKKKEYNISISEANNTVLQYSDSECGVWCLWYIKSRLEGHSKDYFEKCQITDDMITKAREYLFT